MLWSLVPWFVGWIGRVCLRCSLGWLCNLVIGFAVLVFVCSWLFTCLLLFCVAINLVYVSSRVVIVMFWLYGWFRVCFLVLFVMATYGMFVMLFCWLDWVCLVVVNSVGCAFTWFLWVFWLRCLRLSCLWIAAWLFVGNSVDLCCVCCRVLDGCCLIVVGWLFSVVFIDVWGLSYMVSGVF